VGQDEGGGSQRALRASIRQVADAAGVSTSTVSNVPNNPDVVATSTRRRVEDAMSEVGYVRNGAARQLRGAPSTIAGCLLLLAPARHSGARADVGDRVRRRPVRRAALPRPDDRPPRSPDPSDRRAKLIRPTERGVAQMRTADAIMAAIQQRHTERLGEDDYGRFKRQLIDITEHQRAHNTSRGDD
jgi:hypothetical protein